MSYREMLNDQVWEPLPTYSEMTNKPTSRKDCGSSSSYLPPRPVSQNKDVWRAAVSYREKTGEPPSVETPRPAHECSEWGTPFREISNNPTSGKNYGSSSSLLAPRPASQDRGSWRAAVNYRETEASSPSQGTVDNSMHCSRVSPFNSTGVIASAASSADSGNKQHTNPTPRKPESQ